MKRLTIPALSCLLVLVFTLASALPAMAHKVRIFAYSDTDTIFVESQFSKTSPAQNCLVTMTDASGNEVGSCTTDETGQCEMPVPEGASGDLTLTVHAGEGHQGSWTLLEADYK